MPSRTSCPAGYCIQLLAERIQKPERAVPPATITAEMKCRLGGTRFQPKSMTPRKEASRKKADSTS
ncbi:hypothetical protein D3C87_2028580 [compost metagenome]